MAIEKIVVVDDELMIRKTLETQLRNKRYSVASASDLKVHARFYAEILLILSSLISGFPMVRVLIYLRK